MGNILGSATHKFPCQLCHSVFERQISGPLLCPECRIYNKFNMWDFETKSVYIMSCISYVDVETIKNLEFDKTIELDSEVVKQTIKKLSLEKDFAKKYRMIKYIHQFLERSNYVNIYLGYFVVLNKRNVLCVWNHLENKDKQETFLKIDFDDLIMNISRSED